MNCLCLRKLKAFTESLKNLPLNMVASLLPKDLPQLSMLGGMASGLVTAQAMASASAQAQLRAALMLGLPPFPIPALDLGRLEAMAYLSGTTGANALNADMSLSLQRMATSVNVNLPSIMQMLMELLQPLLDSLMDLLALLQSFDAVHAALGINLASAGAMAALDLRGLPINLLPDVSGLATAARLGEATGIKVWSSSPCSASCPVGSTLY